MKIVQDIVQKYRYLLYGSSFSVPIGGIIAYTGALNALPLNYHLCDGTDGTPDLRDRFIVGAGSSYNLNTIGGTSTNILALNQLPNLADFLNKLLRFKEIIKLMVLII